MSETDLDLKNKEYRKLIDDLLREIKYGTISIVIQDGRIVQVEKNEKFRITGN